MNGYLAQITARLTHSATTPVAVIRPTMPDPQVGPLLPESPPSVTDVPTIMPPPISSNAPLLPGNRSVPAPRSASSYLEKHVSRTERVSQQPLSPPASPGAGLNRRPPERHSSPEPTAVFRPETSATRGQQPAYSAVIPPTSPPNLAGPPRLPNVPNGLPNNVPVTSTPALATNSVQPATAPPPVVVRPPVVMSPAAVPSGTSSALLPRAEAPAPAPAPPALPTVRIGRINVEVVMPAPQTVARPTSRRAAPLPTAPAGDPFKLSFGFGQL